MKIRKQVYELAKHDLRDRAIWEFALDEEGEEGQDEATVRPWNQEVSPNPADRMFVARATFVLADGTLHLGYLTPGVHGDMSIATIQPIIVTDHGQVIFWHGVLAPTSELIEEGYQRLGRVAEHASDVRLADGPVSGTLAGFMHFRSFSDQTVLTIT